MTSEGWAVERAQLVRDNVTSNEVWSRILIITTLSDGSGTPSCNKHKETANIVVKC